MGVKSQTQVSRQAARCARDARPPAPRPPPPQRPARRPASGTACWRAQRPRRSPLSFVARACLGDALCWILGLFVQVMLQAAWSLPAQGLARRPRGIRRSHGCCRLLRGSTRSAWFDRLQQALTEADLPLPLLRCVGSSRVP